ncbi:hypothetical protein EI016_24850, partial [Escherichia coli]|nr:hypothetical protein [Escherichia coli]
REIAGLGGRNRERSYLDVAALHDEARRGERPVPGRAHGHGGGGGGDGFVRSSWESDGDEDDENGEMMPPHEWLARKYASTAFLTRLMSLPFSVL